MPEVVMAEIHEEWLAIESNENEDSTHSTNNSVATDKSPKSTQIVGNGYTIDEVVDTSIEHLYDNVCDMQSSDQSPSRCSFGSDGEESRIDSELRHPVGGEMREVEIMEEEVAMQKAVEAVYENHPRPKQLIVENNLPEKLQNLIEERQDGKNSSGYVLVKQMATSVLKALHVNTIL